MTNNDICAENIKWQLTYIDGFFSPRVLANASLKSATSKWKNKIKTEMFPPSFKTLFFLSPPFLNMHYVYSYLLQGSSMGEPKPADSDCLRRWCFQKNIPLIAYISQCSFKKTSQGRKSETYFRIGRGRGGYWKVKKCFVIAFENFFRVGCKSSPGECKCILFSAKYEKLKE